MGPLERIAREFRFLDGLARTLGAVRAIDPDSDVLVCDDFETAVDKFADHTALVFEGRVLEAEVDVGQLPAVQQVGVDAVDVEVVDRGVRERPDRRGERVDGEQRGAGERELRVAGCRGVRQSAASLRLLGAAQVPRVRCRRPSASRPAR